MSTVKDGQILRLSVSQLEKFIACGRHWYFEAVRGRYPEDTEQSEDGKAGHALVAKYLRTGERPGRVKMGKMVNGAIDAGLFPAPSPDLIVERRFSGQEQYDSEGKWITLDPTKAKLFAAGIPLDGSSDLIYRQDGIVHVVDHKFTSDINGDWTLSGEDLLNTVQMPGYAIYALTIWPDATMFELRHNYISRKGVASDPRSVVVTVDQIRARWAEVERVVAEEMTVVAKATEQGGVPYAKDPRTCEKYLGCPHQARCHAFKERKPMIKPEDLALFGEEPAKPAAPVKAAPVDPFAGLDQPAAPMIPEPSKTAAAPEPAKVIPPDAPANDANAPAPEKSKRKGRAIKIQTEDGKPDPEVEAAVSKKDTYPTDGPGWVMFKCTVCGQEIKKVPPGNTIHESLCPNKANHPIVEAAKPAPPAPSLSAGVTVVEFGPQTQALLKALIDRLTQ